MAKHTNSPICGACEEKLKGVDSRLVSFVEQLRGIYPDAHVCWGVRGEAEQELFKKQGTSKASFGQSPHNYGLAVDIFRLTLSNSASFDPVWYRTKLAPVVAANPDLVWGGTFKSLVDLPHVELANWKTLKGHLLT